MKRILFNGLFLIGLIASVQTVFGMEDPAGFSESFDIDINQLFVSQAPSMNTHLTYLSCYANALLLQDQIINQVRVVLEARKKYDSILSKIYKAFDGEFGKNSIIDFIRGLNEYETLMVFSKHSVLSKLDLIKEFSKFELDQLKNLKLTMENSDSKELQIVALWCEKTILRSELYFQAKSFSNFILKFHINNLYEGDAKLVYSMLSIKDEKFKKLFENERTEYINNISYNDIVKALLSAPNTQLKFGNYSYVLRFYDDLSLAGKERLKTYKFFIKFIDINFFKGSDLVEELQKKLDFYDENRFHYIQLYQVILQFLKQEVSKDFSMRDVLSIQESSSKGKQSSNISRMPDTFAQVQLDQEILIEGKDDFLPDSLRKSTKKIQKAKAKGRGKNKGKPKGKPKSQPKQKQKVRESQLLQPEKIEKVLLSEKACDGSFVLENNEDYMVVSDQKNNMKVRILKSDRESSVTLSGKQLNELVMTNWVKDWYEKPDEALDYQGYKDPTNLKFTTQELYEQATVYHTPAMILLKHIKALAQQRMIESRKIQGKQDILFTMPVINFYDNKQIELGKNWQSGVAAWIVDSEDNKTIYHAEFRPTGVSKMVQDFTQDGFFQISFPTLSEVQEYNQH